MWRAAAAVERVRKFGSTPTWPGCPVAVLGLAGYIAILVTLLLVPGDAGRFAGAFLGIAGTGFSAYLTYLELFVINAICQWCVASAIVMTLLTCVVLARAVRGAPTARSAA